MSLDGLKDRDKKDENHDGVLGKNDNNDDYSESTVLTAKFGFEATRLIHLIQKNLYVVVGLILFIAALSLINIFGVIDYFLSENADKAIDTILLVMLVGVLAPLLLLLTKSKKVLDRWDEMFERNTIATSMKIAMNDRSKEETIIALTQSVEQIGEPLQNYISSNKSDLKEFLDVCVDKNIVFDILIDSNHVLNDVGHDTNKLKNILDEYGAVIVKVEDNSIDISAIKTFIESLSRYISLSKNRVGLAIVTGENTTQEVDKYMRKYSSKLRKDGVKHFITVTKPTFPPSMSPKPPEEQV